MWSSAIPVPCKFGFPKLSYIDESAAKEPELFLDSKEQSEGGMRNLFSFDFKNGIEYRCNP
jgi:hypothetical protein